MNRTDFTQAEVTELMNGTYHDKVEQRVFTAWITGMHSGWNDACDRCERPDQKMATEPVLN